MGIDSKPRLNWTKILSESNPSESSPWQQKSTKITFKMLSLTTETGGGNKTNPPPFLLFIDLCLKKHK